MPRASGRPSAADGKQKQRRGGLSNANADLNMSLGMKPLNPLTPIKTEEVELGELLGNGKKRGTLLTDNMTLDKLPRDPDSDMEGSSENATMSSPASQIRKPFLFMNETDDFDSKSPTTPSSQNGGLKRTPSMSQLESGIIDTSAYLWDDEVVVEDIGSCLIHPNNRYKSIWDFFILLLLVFLLIFLPIRLAFDPESYNALMVGNVNIVDTIIDLCFFADILVNFMTAYHNRFGRLVIDHKKIATRYVKTWFLLDVVSTIPVHLFLASETASLTSLAKIPRLLKLVRLLRFLRFLKAYRFREFMAAIEFSRHIHPSVFRVFKLLCSVLLFAHVGACFFYFLGDIQETPSAWIHTNVDEDNGKLISEQTAMSKYTTSMYWLLTTLTTIGYGDITARTNAEMVFASVTMVCGAIFFAYTTAAVSSIMVTADKDVSGLREKMNKLRVFSRGFKLDANLDKALSAYMKTEWEKPPISAKQDWTELLSDMPQAVRTTVIKFVYARLLEESPLFARYADDDVGDIDHFLSDLFRQLHPMQRMRGDVLATREETFEHWFIVQEGTVHAVSSVDETFVYLAFKDGMSFGDIPLFLQSGRWEYTAIVHSPTCYLLNIAAEDLRRVFVRDVANCRARSKLHGKRYIPFIERLMAQTRVRLDALRKAKVARATARTHFEPKQKWRRDGSIIGSNVLRQVKVPKPDVEMMGLLTDQTGKKQKMLIVEMFREVKNLTELVNSLKTDVANLSEMVHTHQQEQATKQGSPAAGRRRTPSMVERDYRMATLDSMLEEHTKNQLEDAFSGFEFTREPATETKRHPKLATRPSFAPVEEEKASEVEHEDDSDSDLLNSSTESKSDSKKTHLIRSSGDSLLESSEAEQDALGVEDDDAEAILRISPRPSTDDSPNNGGQDEEEQRMSINVHLTN